MLQNLGLLFAGAVIGILTMIVIKPLRAMIIAMSARGADPEAKVVLLTKAFELDRGNCRVAHDLAEARILLSRRNKSERMMHLQEAANVLLFAESNHCHWWSTNPRLKQSVIDLRQNVSRKLTNSHL